MLGKDSALDIYTNMERQARVSPSCCESGPGPATLSPFHSPPLSALGFYFLQSQLGLASFISVQVCRSSLLPRGSVARPCLCPSSPALTESGDRRLPASPIIDPTRVKARLPPSPCPPALISSVSCAARTYGKQQGIYRGGAQQEGRSEPRHSVSSDRRICSEFNGLTRECTTNTKRCF